MRPQRPIIQFRHLRKRLARNRIYPIPVPISQLSAASGEMEWLWEGYLTPGHITLLSGLPKAGKTTLLSHLIQRMGCGGNLAGAIHQGKVLIITEESSCLWSDRRDDLGIGDHAYCISRPFILRPSESEWAGFLEHLAGYVADDVYRVVVFDSIAALSPCRDENDSIKMLDALQPLHILTKVKAAILLIHHLRKSDGTEGTAARGSGALTGFVDIICELRRLNPGQTEDNQRVLTAYSRFSSPGDVVLELTPGGYISHGSRQEASQKNRRDIIREILSKKPTGLRVEDVKTCWPEDQTLVPGIRTLRGDLQKGVTSGQWAGTGSGRKGDPYCYYPLSTDRGDVLGSESITPADSQIFDSGKPHPIVPESNSVG